MRYDPEDRQGLLEVLVGALAEAGDVAVTELPPLYETIDVEAVTDLFGGASGRVGEKLLSFTVENWHVFVHADGRIRICDGREEIEPVPVFETPSA